MRAHGGNVYSARGRCLHRWRLRDPGPDRGRRSYPRQLWLEIQSTSNHCLGDIELGQLAASSAIIYYVGGATCSWLAHSPLCENRHWLWKPAGSARPRSISEWGAVDQAAYSPVICAKAQVIQAALPQAFLR